MISKQKMKIRLLKIIRAINHLSLVMMIDQENKAFYSKVPSLIKLVYLVAYLNSKIIKQTN